LAEPTPLLAVNVKEYVPPLPDAGVPLSVAVPFPLFTNVTPLGSAPVSVTDGVGVPVVVTVKFPAAPTVNIVLLALVIAGAWFTVSVKLWLAAVPTPLLAVIVREYVPPLPDAGVPLSVAVPFPLLTNVTPLGSAPVSVTDGVGFPVVVTVKLPAAPIVNVVWLALVIAGAWFTVSVKLWLAELPTPLLAVNVKEYVPPLPDAGVPLSVAVPFPLLTNVTPLGSAPVSVTEGVGVPVVVTVKLPAAPAVNVALLTLVITGACVVFTISVKLWLAELPTPLLAVIVREYVPPLPDAGVPLSVAVPFPLLTNVTPLGNAPVSVAEGVGVPVVVTVKFPAAPTVNVELLALVIAGAWFTVSVKLWLAAVPTPLLAVIVREYVPPLPAAGVPLSVAVPFPLLTNVTPLGSAPVSVTDGVGVPVVVTVKFPAAPTVNVVLLLLVIAGAWFTVSVKLWLAELPTPLLAVIVREYVPTLPDAGVPLSVAVPFPLLTNVTPLGSAPVSVTEGVGVPVVVTVKLPAAPTVNVELLALVIAGACVAFAVTATNPRITLSLVPVPKVALCAPAATPTLSSIS
jgi:hypothetical protein